MNSLIAAPASAWEDVLHAARRHARGLEPPEILLATDENGSPAVVASDAQTKLRLDMDASTGRTDAAEIGYVDADPLYQTAKGLSKQDRSMKILRGNDTVFVRSGDPTSADAFEAHLDPSPTHDAFGLDSELSDPEASVTMDAEALRAVLYRTSFAASDDALRPSMVGVHFNLPEGDVVATDGHRLSEVDLTETSDLTVTIPLEAVETLLNVLPSEGNVRVSANDRAIRVAWDGGSLRTAQIDESFPNYQQVQPSGECLRVEADRDDLIRVCSLAEIYGPERDVEGTNRVAMWRDEGGQLHFEAEDIAASSEMHERLPCDTHENPPLGEEGPLTIYYNPSYLEEILRRLTSDTVLLELHGQMKPMGVRPPRGEGEGDLSQYAIVMPIQP